MIISICFNKYYKLIENSLYIQRSTQTHTRALSTTIITTIITAIMTAV